MLWSFLGCLKSEDHECLVMSNHRFNWSFGVLPLLDFMLSVPITKPSCQVWNLSVR